MTGADVAAAFVRLQSHLAARNGEFSFFALFQRDEVPDRWDLIVSARWLGSDRTAAVRILVDEIKSFLGTPYLIALSRIIIVDPSDPQLKTISRSISTEHGPAEVRESYFFGLPIKHAYIITSKPQEAPVV